MDNDDVDNDVVDNDVAEDTPLEEGVSKKLIAKIKGEAKFTREELTSNLAKEKAKTEAIESNGSAKEYLRSSEAKNLENALDEGVNLRLYRQELEAIKSNTEYQKNFIDGIKAKEALQKYFILQEIDKIAEDPNQSKLAEGLTGAEKRFYSKILKEKDNYSVSADDWELFTDIKERLMAAQIAEDKRNFGGSSANASLSNEAQVKAWQKELDNIDLKTAESYIKRDVLRQKIENLNRGIAREKRRLKNV